MSVGRAGLGDRVLLPPFLLAGELAGGAVFTALAIQNAVAGSGDLIALYAPIGAAGLVGVAIQVLLPTSWSQNPNTVRVVETLIVSANPGTVGQRVTRALTRVCGTPPEARNESDGRAVYRGCSERSWRSWGEWVEVALSGTDAETAVSIASTPRGHQFLTFGACSRNVDRVRNSVLDAAA